MCIFLYVFFPTVRGVNNDYRSIVRRIEVYLVELVQRSKPLHKAYAMEFPTI